MAVERVRDGESASSVIASFNFNCTTRRDGGGRTARQAWTDAAEAAATGVSARPWGIEAWRRERFPELVREAKASGDAIFSQDESGFRADAGHGKTWGVKGQTPVVDAPANGNRSVRPRRECARWVLVLHL